MIAPVNLVNNQNLSASQRSHRMNIRNAHLAATDKELQCAVDSAIKLGDWFRVACLLELAATELR